MYKEVIEAAQYPRRVRNGLLWCTPRSQPSPPPQCPGSLMFDTETVGFSCPVLVKDHAGATKKIPNFSGLKQQKVLYSLLLLLLHTVAATIWLLPHTRHEVMGQALRELTNFMIFLYHYHGTKLHSSSWKGKKKGRWFMLLPLAFCYSRNSPGRA